MPKKIVILASGGGTNAENIIYYFQSTSKILVHSVLTNNPFAGVIARASKLEIPCMCFDPMVKYPNFLVDYLSEVQPDLIVLAGYLKIIPKDLIALFPNRIVNIHPALLPNYGGKGMYGMRVHQAVKDAGEAFSGISIHQVNEKYDEGTLLFQAKTAISKNDSVEEIAEKVQALEYVHYPKVIESLLND